MSWLQRVMSRLRRSGVSSTLLQEPVADPEATPESEKGSLPSAERVMATCGHYTLPRGEVSAYGETIFLTLRQNEAGAFEYCLDCIEAMMIRCAWCGGAILIGQPVTLIVAKPGFSVPDGAVVYSEEPLRLVGCLGCSSMVLDRAGHWVPDPETTRGYVRLMPSPLTYLMNGARGVIVKDVNDPNEQPTVVW